MTHFADLSKYEYFQSYVRPQTLNVGWLASGIAFKKEVPADSDLNLLWEFCKISVVQTRGIHPCDLCSEFKVPVIEHGGGNLLLGAAEIRIFSPDGTIFAAPNLIFHYMSAHHYRPPDEFLNGLRNGPKASSLQYLQRLERLQFEWRPTSSANRNVRAVRLGESRS